MLWQVADWDNAYANGANIAGGDRWPAAWVEPARNARAALAAAGRASTGLAYGSHPRQHLDLFRPEGTAKGLVVFVHGGFWLRLDCSFWSHLAAGPLAHGWAVAMPSYRLAPEARISEISRDVAAAITHAAGLVAGPIRLTGHSAGGHLVTRMVTTTSPLDPAVQARIAGVVSISGVHDLQPMRLTAMNAGLHIDAAEVAAESPARLPPIPGTRLTAWVGGAERAEFRRQSALLANIWTGFGVATDMVEEPDRHHFDVVDGLADPDHPLTRSLLA